MRTRSIEIQEFRIVDTVRWPITSWVGTGVVRGDAVGDAIGYVRIVIYDEVSDHFLEGIDLITVS